jgi:26S proteasome regulatory subunit N11
LASVSERLTKVWVHRVDSQQALIHGLNRHYYSIGINYRKTDLEEQMLLNLHKKKWADGLTLTKFDKHAASNQATVAAMQVTL